ncbi:hypothetical protein E2C01_063630 [Portunus trituberculatus]|uniref:Uncharacterized protein n=1 Tax=Portunus trituberculatus TaxID=210409 RepID=A0A5B7HHK2_PORTR|nr:hypothetical protein [Portunus trituberculatus]
MDQRVHAWQFEFKLGSHLAATRQTTRLPTDVRPLSKPIRMQCESPLKPFCLCYPLFWRFTDNMASTRVTGGTGGG